MPIRHLLCTAAALCLAAPALAAPTPPKSVELYAMDCGRMALPNADMFSDDGAYKDKPVKMVVPCYLVRHPKGDLVWDTGLPAPAATAAPPAGATPPRPLADQLKDLGLSPADIEYVSVSHSHFDHIGQAGVFAGSTWVVDPDEKATAFSEAARKAPAFAAYSALEKSTTKLIEAPSYDVFGDKTVVIYQAPGHTPGHTVLLVKTKGGGNVLLTGDLWHVAESRAGKKVPRFNFNRAQTLASYELAEKLAAETKAKVIRQHVPEDFEALPKFPKPLK